MPAFRIEGLSTGYGALTVVHDLDLEISEGDVLAILGANGVGKSTLLRCLAGLLPAKQGRTFWDGTDITELGAPQRVRHGIALVPEGRMLFAPMSVYDHLWLGTNPNPVTGTALAMRLDHVFNLFPALRARQGSIASTLSGGQQQMLAIGRALMCSPKLLLLDEPSMGVAPKLREEIYAALRQLIATTGLSVVVVEQDGPLALKIARRVVVMQSGRIVKRVAAAEIESTHAFADLYLGQAI